MRTSSTISLCFAGLLVIFAPGCTSIHATRPDRPAADIQDQWSAALTGARYAEVFCWLEEGRLEQAKDDMDLWIDMSILQLQMLEEHYPNGDWAAVKTPHGSDISIGMFYREIARFRRDHPRRPQAFSWDAENLKRIEAFVKKYQ